MQNYKEQMRKQHEQNINLLKKLEITKTEFETASSKLEVFRDKLSIKVMVPISSKNLGFMEGMAVHTNELLIILGAKYFAKMSGSDAIQYCQRKCESIKQKQDEISKEQKLIVERLAYMDSLNSDDAEIIENYDENEEKLWRERHSENIKKMKAQEAVEREKINNLPVEHFFSRLEQLEQEELNLEELNTM